MYYPESENGSALVPSQEDVREKILDLAPLAVGVVGRILRNPRAPVTAQIQAIEIILDRTYGKPEALLKAGLPDHQILQDLELIGEPKTEKDAEGNVTCSGRTNSDVLMLLTWYRDALGGP